MTQVQAARTGMTEYRQRLKGWEDAQHEQWELARWLAWHSYNLSPFLKQGQRPKTAKDVQTFPWEKGGKKPTKRQARKKARITAGCDNAGLLQTQIRGRPLELIWVR